MPVVEEDQLHAAGAVADGDLGDGAVALPHPAGVHARDLGQDGHPVADLQVVEAGHLAAPGVAARVVAQQVADRVQVELLGHALRRLRAEHAGRAGSRRVTAMRHSTPTCRRMPLGAAVVPGHLDGGVLARPGARQTASPSAASGPTTSVAISPPADSSRSSRSQDDGGEVAADHHDVALGRAEDVAGLAAAGRGERLLLGDGDLGPAGGRRGLGHGDDVVAEAAAGVGDGDRGQPLHRRPGGDDADVAARRRGPGRRRGRRSRISAGVVGQDDDLVRRRRR